jgi:hypothetical protein
MAFNQTLIFIISFSAILSFAQAQPNDGFEDLSHLSDKEVAKLAKEEGSSAGTGFLSQAHSATMFLGRVFAPSFLAFVFVNGATIQVANSYLDPFGQHYPSTHPDSVKYGRFAGAIAAAATAYRRW